MSSTRSKLYERYNVELPTTSSSKKAAGSNKKWRGWLNYNNNKEDEARRQQLPIEEWTNVEMIKYILKNASFRSKLIAILVIMILSSIIISTIFYPKNASNNSTDLVKNNSGPVMTKYGLRPDKMSADSHARSNPFAPVGHTSYMEGVLEVKRIGGRKDKKKNDNNPPPPPPPPPMQDRQQQQQTDDVSKTQDNNNMMREEPPGKRAKKGKESN